jgi:hypothetical protein
MRPKPEFLIILSIDDELYNSKPMSEKRKGAMSKSCKTRARLIA